ncbi:MAG: carboxypeptidase-like regulatory domain-containing protein [Ignavibacteria bacterium]|jgi:hypothetical protein
MKKFILLLVVLLSNHLSYGQDSNGIQIWELNLTTSKDTIKIKSRYIIRNIYTNKASSKSKVIGKVTALENGQALPGTNVGFIENELVVVADSTGNYSMENISSGKYTIIASFVGYQRLETQIDIKENEVTVIDFQLAEEIIPSSDFYALPVVPPFSNDTNLEYELSATSQVDIKIYDILGNLCRTLVSEIQDKGKHKVNWDYEDDNGSTMKNGTYLMRLEINGKKSHRGKRIFFNSNPD